MFLCDAAEKRFRRKGGAFFRFGLKCVRISHFVPNGAYLSATWRPHGYAVAMRPEARNCVAHPP